MYPSPREVGALGPPRGRLLALAAMLAAVAGALPMVPRAAGFAAATVTLDSTATYYPATAPDSGDPPFISCVLDPEANALITDTIHTGNFVRCTNNWGTAVTIGWSIAGGGTATGISASGSASIPAGAQNQCLQITLYADATAAGGTVRYRGTIDQSDLYAVIEFAGTLSVGSDPPTECV